MAIGNKYSWIIKYTEQSLSSENNHSVFLKIPAVFGHSTFRDYLLTTWPFPQLHNKHT
jgi:hypothetical protein